VVWVIRQKRNELRAPLVAQGTVQQNIYFCFSPAPPGRVLACGRCNIWLVWLGQLSSKCHLGFDSLLLRGEFWVWRVTIKWRFGCGTKNLWRVYAILWESQQFLLRPMQDRKLPKNQQESFDKNTVRSVGSKINFAFFWGPFLFSSSWNVRFTVYRKKYFFFNFS